MTIKTTRPPKTPTPPSTVVPTSSGGGAIFIPNSGTGGGIPVRLPFIPPNGFAGFAQQTPATVATVMRPRSKASARRARAGAKKRGMNGSARKKGRAAVRKASRRAGQLARMTKGSAAAKRHMAKLRSMRKR